MDDNMIMALFILGEWISTHDICRILHISFSDGVRIFDLSRTAEWCPAPFEGQHIETYFRIKPVSNV